MLKNTLMKATEAAGLLMKARFNSGFRIDNKEGINNLVTEVDHASEALIMDRIKAEYPDHFILSEETGEIRTDSPFKWIIFRAFKKIESFAKLSSLVNLSVNALVTIPLNFELSCCKNSAACSRGIELAIFAKADTAASLAYLSFKSGTSSATT